MDTTRTVFLGSIPFDQTEEQVMEIARSIGPVEDMKLLFDNMTGKSKGSAYIRYSDHETAASAVRNLNNFAIGNRLLSCSFSADNAMNNLSSGNGISNTDNGSNAATLPMLPPGMQLFPGQTPPQGVASALSSLDTSSAYQFIKEAVTMARTNSQLTTTLFEQCPQLAHALVETCIRLKVIGPETVQLLLNKKANELIQLNPDHIALLQQVNQLTEQEKNALPEDKRNVLEKIQLEIKNGSYGEVL